MCGECDGEADEEDEGGEESRMVFLGQLRRPSLLLLAFRETGEESKAPSHSNLTSVTTITQLVLLLQPEPKYMTNYSDIHVHIRINV